MFPVIKGTACSHGKNRVIATINPKGKIEIVSFKDKKSFFGVEIPFLRGITIFLFGIYIFMLSLNRSQIVLGKENKRDEIEDKIAKKLKIPKNVVILTIAGIIGALIGVLEFFWCPILSSIHWFTTEWEFG